MRDEIVKSGSGHESELRWNAKVMLACALCCIFFGGCEAVKARTEKQGAKQLRKTLNGL